MKTPITNTLLNIEHHEVGVTATEENLLIGDSLKHTDTMLFDEWVLFYANEELIN